VRSALYRGWVRHRRLEPVPHAFRSRLFMMYLDLAELPRLFDGRWLWSARRFAPAWFRRADYLGDPATPLADAVRDRVAERIGLRPGGPVRMLTHLRYFGYCFNPVTFYYCFDEADTRVQAIVAEITNTPWKERHAYVLACRGDARRQSFGLRKEFHVSPFMDMDHRYRWSFVAPGTSLVVHMESFEDGAKLFDATLSLRREPITGASLARALLRHPFMTASVTAGIHWQALRLWLKRCPSHVHPAKRVPA